LEDVEQAEFASLAALCDARGQALGGTGVGAVDDEGFVGEFCKGSFVSGLVGVV
jgi:hypothetical protein